MGVVRFFVLPALVGTALLVSSCARPASEGVRADSKPASDPAPAPAQTPAEKDPVLLFPVKVDGKYGFIDAQGKIVIQPKFAGAVRFSEGLAGVQDNTDKWGFIDKTGEYRIKPTYEAILAFSEGLAPVMVGGKFGFIDPTGKMVIQPKYAGAAPFKNGLAAIARVEEMAGQKVQTTGFIDKQEKFLMDPVLSDAGSFSEGLAAARWMGQHFSYIDTTGKKVIESGTTANRQFQRAGEFSGGLAPVLFANTNRWGFINRRGEVAIQPKYGAVLSFSEGLAAVLEQPAKWGYIDVNGKTVIEPKFTDAGSFLHGLAQVAVGDKIGYIDREGKYVWMPRS